MREKILQKLISLSKQRTIVPFYHKVSDCEQTFEKYLYATRKVLDFKKDIDIFNKYYKSISLFDFIEISNSKKKHNQNYYHLTFDDGLANFYKIVAPILLERKITATVFINTDFIDNRALFYRYKASLLYQFYENTSTKNKNKYHDFFQKNSGIKNILLSINFNSKNILDELANEIDYSFEEYLEVNKPYLNSKQIEELQDKGFTIGAHSKNHPLYADIELKDQVNQTIDSVNFLKKNYNLDYSVFSFPFTDLNVTNEFFYKLEAMESKLDFSFGSSGIKRDQLKNNFQRIFFEIGARSAEEYLLQEYIKYFFKIPLKKNIMPRN